MTWGYLAWSLVPVSAAVVSSLHADPTASAIGFDAYRAVLADGEIRRAFLQSASLALLTAAIAVPLGTALGLALVHIRGRAWRAVRFSLLMMIAMPHAVLAVMLFYLFAYVVDVPFTTAAQLLGHVTIALPFVALVVWTRMLLLDPTYEEQAADLGAPPSSTVLRVVLPLSLPAIIVSATVAFAISFNEIPLSRYLCIPNECRTIPVMFSGRALGTVPPPALAASVLASIASVGTLAISLVVLRRLRTRGQEGGSRARPETTASPLPPS